MRFIYMIGVAIVTASDLVRIYIVFSSLTGIMPKNLDCGLSFLFDMISNHDLIPF